MKKILLTLLAMSILVGATAQTKKCGIDTKALAADQIAAGATHIDMLAKMVPGFNRDMFEKAGIIFGAQAGQIVTMSVPVEELPLLDESKDVLLYSISHPIAQPTCENTRFDTRTDSVQAGLGIDGDTSFNGAGVYIGITDWGFDYTHPNYNHIKKNNHRLLMAWDQFRLSGPAPAGFNYGTLISGRHDLLAAMGDTSNIYSYGTHGTHVAGICAGRGVDDRLAGQAPYANLLFCTFLLGEKQWMDGVAWMRQVAQDSAKRLVVNSSWGMYSFSCLDGHSLLSEAINNWSDEGIVFCTSGGNNGDDKFHLSRTFQPGTPDTMRSIATWFQSNEGTGQVLIHWGEVGHDFSVAFAMKKNDSTIVSVPYMSTAMGDTVISDSLTFEGTKIPYRAYIEHANPFDQRPHIQLNVGMDRSMQLLLFVTATDGTVHVWNVADKQNHAGNEGCAFSSGRITGYTDGDDLYGVGEPACAAKCISVAAHSADRINVVNDNQVYVPGNLAYFSSYGPLIDGTQKPEISAPGVEVVSSISAWTTSSYMAQYTKSVLGQRYCWASMSGTSMSSPAVTGIVALILQANPTLSVDQIRDIIFTTARNDSITGPLVARDSMSVRWGWGKIDARRAVNKALSMVGINQVETLRTPLKVYPNPATTNVVVKTLCGEPQTLQVYSADGRKMVQTPVTLETTLDISGWPRGVYILRVGSRSEKLIVQ